MVIAHLGLLVILYNQRYINLFAYIRVLILFYIVFLLCCLDHFPVCWAKTSITMADTWSRAWHSPTHNSKAARLVQGSYSNLKGVNPNDQDSWKFPNLSDEFLLMYKLMATLVPGSDSRCQAQISSSFHLLPRRWLPWSRSDILTTWGAGHPHWRWKCIPQLHAMLRDFLEKKQLKDLLSFKKNWGQLRNLGCWSKSFCKFSPASRGLDF